MPSDNIKELIGSAGQRYIRARHDYEIDHPTVSRNTKSKKNENKALILFLSYDVVNSTAYKDLDEEWPNLLLGMFHEIEKSFKQFEADNMCPVRLWRIIGDEIIFTVEVQSEDTVKYFIETANNILLRINENNRKAESWKDKLFLEHQHIVRNITLKATAWISIVNMNWEEGDYYLKEHESIHMLYQNNTKEWFREYYGNDIDAGFRLEKYSRSDRMVLSFELAYLLEMFGEGKYLHIIAYESLKGIWRNRLYPIIWYYRPNEEKRDLQASFDETFTYDAAVNDSLIGKYLDIRQNMHYKNALHPIKADMYEVSQKTMRKIASDTGVTKKIEKMLNECKNPSYRNDLSDSAFMRLDCVAVCYKMEEKTPSLLALKTIPLTRADSSKWCFGSAVAHVGDSVTKTLINGYKEAGIVIQPLLYDSDGYITLLKDMDENAIDSEDPIPIGLFERDDQRSSGSQRKGIICVAKIENDTDNNDFLKGNSYEKFRFITEAELSGNPDNLFGEDDVIYRFNRTARIAFDLIKQYEKK